MQTPPLRFENLSKNFGEVRAVNDLTFTVEPGRVTGFLGPNGAGKTTTLRMLLGLIAPSGGRALIGDRLYSALEDPMKVVGAHLDSGSFNPGRTGRNHMRVACAEGGIDPAAINPLLDLVGMRDAADRRMGGYSLGMQQRLGLATALLGDPAVLVLDEPANGLDPEGIRWLREFLRTLAGQGRTVFLSSHLLGEIQQMAHDVVIINHGRLVTAGSVKDLEQIDGSRVLVDAPDREALLRALQAARLSVAPSAGLSGDPNSPGLVVTGTSSQAVGQVALVAGIPLNHLSEQTSGLEDLFMNLVGGTQ